MKKVKIAQIGTSKNSHGKVIWQSLIKQNDVFEVVGFALPENEKEKFPKEVKVFEGYREMTVDEILSDPEIEAVAVETEEIYLTKYALMVAKAGKHLHMEKPGGTCLADFEELVDVLKEKGLTFSTGYMYRFNPIISKVLNKVKNGELGKIYSVEAQMNCHHSAETKKWLGCFEGGMMFFLGCHLIDLIYQIQGEPEEVIPMNTSTGIDEISSKDFGMAVFKYKNGVSFAKTTAVERGGYLRRQLVICGEKGTVEIKPLEFYIGDKHGTVLNESYESGWNIPWKTSQSELYDRYDTMTRNFAEMIRGKENPYSYDYEYNLYKLILKACGKEI